MKETNKSEPKARICFILDHALMHYRVPFFEKLVARRYEVLVVHSGKRLGGQSSFSEHIAPSHKLYGVVYRKLPGISKFDIVVHMQNLRFINLWALSLSPFRRFKLIQWGIGTSSGRGLVLKRNMLSQVRNILASFCDAQVLYSLPPLKLFSKKVQEKSFIANNTVDSPISKNCSAESKDSVLFIGSLTKRKGLEILIRAFLTYLTTHTPKTIKNLVIVGDGPILNELHDMLKDEPHQNSILLVGSRKSPQDKLQYFERAVVSISPLQAGLSVLESFSFGVPFITFENCISGGEHFNIVDNHNGYLIQQESDIVTILTSLDRDPGVGRRLGQNAYDHYNSSRKMKYMVDSFVDAFEFVQQRQL